MSTVTTHVTKFQMGAAACALAVAATVTPAVVAQAQPDLMPSGPIQLALDTPPWWLLNGTGPGIAITTSGLPGNPILAFQPISLLPGFLQPAFGWFNNINIGICVAGLGAQIGPYGTVSVKTGSC